MNSVQKIIDQVKARDPNQPEFIQAVTEVLTSLIPILEKEPKYQQVLPLIVEPERVITFRVPWMDDNGKLQVNRGYRVQFNSAIGPYKGGLRFRGNVNLSILKFLGFEQVFKNSLTTLPMGGAKGGSDFNPEGKSDAEVMRFCQSFMIELQRHIGGFLDVPAGDIGVGAREIGYMFGMYKKVKNVFEGVLTGKGLSYGGSLIRPEATGYGLIYFVNEMLKSKNEEMTGKKAFVSGSGNVSQYTCEKLIQLGAIPLAVSDSKGVLLFKEGLTIEHLEIIKKLKNEHRVSLSKIAELYPDLIGYEYIQDKSIWDLSIKYDLALPCATQNEILPKHVPIMVENGVKLVAEGANMPSTNETIELYMKNNIYYGPGKAANAGGVSVSGLEMSQNSIRLSWSREKVDRKLQGIMKTIFHEANEVSKKYGVPLYQGANIAGFKKVADAMLAYGCV
jgi:glutamate dehydrogenase (NADP+)